MCTDLQIIHILLQILDIFVASLDLVVCQMQLEAAVNWQVQLGGLADSSGRGHVATPGTGISRY